MKTKTMSIEVSVSLLNAALAQLTHQNTIMSKEATSNGLRVIETLMVERPNYGSVVKLTISKGEEEVSKEGGAAAVEAE